MGRTMKPANKSRQMRGVYLQASLKIIYTGMRAITSPQQAAVYILTGYAADRPRCLPRCPIPAT